MEIRRIPSPPDAVLLYRVLTDAVNVEVLSESTGTEADLDEVLRHADEIVDNNAPLTGSEAALAPELHSALQHLANRQLNDSGMWSWLAMGPFSKFAIYRWFDRGQLPGTAELTDAQHRRFVAPATLNGFARQAVARMYWGAETLYSPEDGHGLVGVVLGNQDFYQNVFERLLGLHPPVARACARVLREGTEKQRRQTIINLNLVFSTVSAETLDDSELEDLVAELFRQITTLD